MVIKLFSGGKIVGCAYLHLNKSSGYIFNVNVNKANRRQGIGRQLMDHLEKITKSRQRSLLALQVENNNLPAKQLYHQLGFRSYHPHFLRLERSMGHAPGRRIGRFYRIPKPNLGSSLFRPLSSHRTARRGWLGGQGDRGIIKKKRDIVASFGVVC